MVEVVVVDVYHAVDTVRVRRKPGLPNLLYPLCHTFSPVHNQRNLDDFSYIQNLKFRTPFFYKYKSVLNSVECTSFFASEMTGKGYPYMSVKSGQFNT